MVRFGIHSVIVAALMLLSPAGFAQDGAIKAIDAVLLQGKASIGTKAPPNWAPVRNPGNMGLCVAYVLNGRTFDDSPSVIYPRLVGGRSIEDLVSESAGHYKKYSPAFRLEKKKDYRSKSGLTFAIRYFLNGPNPNAFEAVGYLAHKGRFCSLSIPKLPGETEVPDPLSSLAKADPEYVVPKGTKSMAATCPGVARKTRPESGGLRRVES